ncbi:HD domain-containing protein [Agromyces sp. MMS24-JH15]|uniref:HD domain-containing protein n=1 Tax=Agromyces sp. MMS24-JH15 TaxID=3243765 RepID=UPI003749E104
MAGRGIRTDRDLGAALLRIARDEDVPSRALREEGLVDAVPELAALADTPQDPQWHPEGDVLVHSLWAADLAAAHADAHPNAGRVRTAGDQDLDPDRHARLVLAALFHDLGKPGTTRRKDGRIISYGHAERGAELIRSLGRRLDLPQPLVRAVAVIAETHMAHVSVPGEPSAKAVRRLRDRLEASGTSLDDWAVVVRCDGEARGAAARPDASLPWTRVARRLTR